MKKHRWILLLFFLIVLSLGLTPAGVSARESREQEDYPSGFLQLYKTEKNLASSLKLRLWRGLYAGANIEYYASCRDTKLHLAGLYLLPHEFLFFRFYGGAGYQFSRNNDGDFPYLVIGSHFIFLFSEVLYPWEDEAAPLVRFGFSFDF